MSYIQNILVHGILIFKTLKAAKMPLHIIFLYFSIVTFHHYPITFSVSARLEKLHGLKNSCTFKWQLTMSFCTQGICKVVMLEISVWRLIHVWLMSHPQSVSIVCSSTVDIGKKNPSSFWNRTGTSLYPFLVSHYLLPSSIQTILSLKFDHARIKLELIFK